tara:strand:- start:373 stop:510 length:138 start_codon:yes stop_codon:yes gene_type:complete
MSRNSYRAIKRAREAKAKIVELPVPKKAPAKRAKKTTKKATTKDK